MTREEEQRIDSVIFELQKLLTKSVGKNDCCEQSNQSIKRTATHCNIIQFPTQIQTIQPTLQSAKSDPKKYMKLKNGSIKHRSDGRWETRVCWQGKIITTACRKNKAECLKKHREVIEKKLKAAIKYKEPKKQLLLFDYLDRWLAINKKGIIQDASYNQIEICIRLHIKPHTDNKPIGNYSPTDITELLKQIESSRMREYSYTVLFEAFKNAVQNELIKKNPCEAATYRKHKRRKGLSLTRKQESEFKKIIANSPYRYYYLFYLYSGARPDEGFRTYRSDIDLDAKTFRIRGTKNEHSDRIIPIFTPLYQIFNQIPIGKDDHLFTISKSTLIRDFKTVQEALSFEMTLKTLRHTFGTRCAEQNVPTTTIARWMGHSNDKITKSTYIDSNTDFEQIIVKELFQDDPPLD